MKIILIDNYDSFTYNLVHLVKELGVTVDVLKNDSFQLKDLEDYDGILLSPGPGLPKDAGLLTDVIAYYSSRKPILGICLGEQAIGEVFGAKLTNLEQVCHGTQSSIVILKHSTIFEGLPPIIKVGRYHSWVVSAPSLPDSLEITAQTVDRQVMAIEHKIYPVIGIQFHPESILTPYGRTIIGNWIKKIKDYKCQIKN